MCIAAHNYKNGTFFSSIDRLVCGDIVTVYDIAGKGIDYEVYDIFRIKPDETQCLSQDTDGRKVVTLITCNSVNDSFRTIVKAREVL